MTKLNREHTQAVPLEVHGHRGSRGTHPENTFAAFEEAAAAGCDYIEIDLHLSKDNVVVVYHDATLSGAHCRNAAGKPVETPAAIRALTAKEISEFECGTIAQPHFPDQLLGISRIPGFEALLQWRAHSAPRVGFNVEVKLDGPSPALIPDPEFFAKSVVALLRKYQCVAKDRYQSFEFETVRAAKKLEPALRAACLFEDAADFAKITRANGAGTAAPHFKLLTAEIIEDCHAQGLTVIPWTINEAADWTNLTLMGVDGLITDYPKALIAHLKKGGIRAR